MNKSDSKATNPLDYPACLLGCPDFVLGTLSWTITELVEEALAPLNIRLRHYQLLRLLSSDGPRLQSSIGPVLGVDRTTVVSIVDHLEKLKLAKRVRSKEDRRAYHVSVTEKGTQVASQASQLATDVEERMFAPLSAEEQCTIRRLSARLLSEPGIIANAHAKLTRTGVGDEPSAQ
jgi:DNA-binding MarR family transcriptional regulator